MMDIVKSIYPVRTYEVPRILGSRAVSKRESPNVLRNQSDSTHIMTGVDKLHAQGFKGKGIKIGM